MGVGVGVEVQNSGAVLRLLVVYCLVDRVE